MTQPADIVDQLTAPIPSRKSRENGVVVGSEDALQSRIQASISKLEDVSDILRTIQDAKRQPLPEETDEIKNAMVMAQRQLQGGFPIVKQIRKEVFAMISTTGW